ncbi:MAG: hypothetical protein COA80_08585 [Leeuwenhoekiella sp.]|nr:MAG: hypothetical protein COA80_08585 [Leeuwenhoekiella sp.]
MDTTNRYDDEAGLEHFYRLAVKASEEQTAVASAKAYEAMFDIQIQIIHSDYARFKEVLAILPDSFLDLYAQDVIKDISEAPLNYLLSHKAFLGMISDEQYEYVKQQLSLHREGEPLAYNFIRGVELLTEDTPEIALFYFKSVDNLLGDYYLALCYYGLENYENARRLFKQLLQELLDLQKQSSELQSDPDFGLLLYDHCQFILSANVVLGEYEEGEHIANILLQEYTLNEIAAISKSDIKEDEMQSDFEVFVNNYTTVLVGLQKYKEVKKLLEEVRLLRPESILIKSRLNDINEKLKRQETANMILAPVLHKKRAYGLKDFVQSNRFAREEKLEDLIELQIKYGMQVFGKSLEIYQDQYGYGRQYAVPNVNGFIDLLLIDKAADILYVVELKRNTAGVEVYNQIKRYTEGLKLHTSKAIKGIICLHKPSDDLIAKVKEDDSVELFTYHFAFKKLG